MQCVRIVDDIMHGIELLTSSGVVAHPYQAMLPHVPSSEGLEEYELNDLAQKVTLEIDPGNEGFSFMDFRGLLTRMPDLVSTFNIFLV